MALSEGRQLYWNRGFVEMHVTTKLWSISISEEKHLRHLETFKQRGGWRLVILFWILSNSVHYLPPGDGRYAGFGGETITREMKGDTHLRCEQNRDKWSEIIRENHNQHTFETTWYVWCFVSPFASVCVSKKSKIYNKMHNCPRGIVWPDNFRRTPGEFPHTHLNNYRGRGVCKRGCGHTSSKSLSQSSSLSKGIAGGPVP